VKLTLVAQHVQVEDASLHGLVIATNPAAGTQITESSTVSVSVGVTAPDD
jgi:beta-lactam-binding protein with PASTA domain